MKLKFDHPFGKEKEDMKRHCCPWPEKPCCPCRGPQGPQGERGPQGPIGKTPVVTVGETITLPPEDPAEVTATQTEDGVVLNFGIPQGQKGIAANDIFASFATFEVRFTNNEKIGLGTSQPDITGNIVLEDNNQIVLQPGYYYISYSVSTILEKTGYMQITPSFNGSAQLIYGIYFKTGTDYTSAYGSNSIIIDVPAQTSFSLTFNSNVKNRSGAATVAVIKLNRDA